MDKNSKEPVMLTDVERLEMRALDMESQLIACQLQQVLERKTSVEQRLVDMKARIDARLGVDSASFIMDLNTGVCTPRTDDTRKQ